MLGNAWFSRKLGIHRHCHGLPLEDISRPD